MLEKTFVLFCGLQAYSPQNTKFHPKEVLNCPKNPDIRAQRLILGDFGFTFLVYHAWPRCNPPSSVRVLLIKDFFFILAL